MWRRFMSAGGGGVFSGGCVCGEEIMPGGQSKHFICADLAFVRFTIPKSFGGVDSVKTVVAYFGCGGWVTVEGMGRPCFM